MKPTLFFTHYLITYDCSDSKRCSLLNRLLRGFLYQQQYSIFEGELTPSQFERVKEEIEKVIDAKKDNVICYPLSKNTIFAKEVFGTLKYKITRIF